MSLHETGSCRRKHIYSRSLIHSGLLVNKLRLRYVCFMLCYFHYSQSQWAPWSLQTPVWSAGLRAQCWPLKPGICWGRREAVVEVLGESQGPARTVFLPVPLGCCYLWSICHLTHCRTSTAPDSEGAEWENTGVRSLAPLADLIQWRKIGRYWVKFSNCISVEMIQKKN